MFSNSSVRESKSYDKVHRLAGWLDTNSDYDEYFSDKECLPVSSRTCPTTTTTIYHLGSHSSQMVHFHPAVSLVSLVSCQHSNNFSPPTPLFRLKLHFIKYA